MKKIQFISLLATQLIIVFITGIVSKDSGFSIIIALVGVVFNLLVSLNLAYGFLFGAVYALANGIVSYTTGAYASFVFMIILQMPMAVYSFATWKKKKALSDKIMKRMTCRQLIVLALFMITLGLVMFWVLSALSGNKGIGILVDDIFFVFSVTACLLLAFCFKNAYIVTLLSGVGGTTLWLYQALTVGNGISIAAFYLVVTVNSIIAVRHQYYTVSKREMQLSAKA